VARDVNAFRIIGKNDVIEFAIDPRLYIGSIAFLQKE